LLARRVIWVIPLLIIMGQATMNTEPGKKAALGVSLGLVALLCAGCSPATTTVSGTVTYKKKLLTGGAVTFVTEQGMATGPIDNNGAFTVENVPVGTAKVSVFSGGGPPNMNMRGGTGKDRMTAPKDSPPEAEKALQGPKQGTPAVTIPSKYSDAGTSGLTREVTSGQNPPYNIELTD
jgi:hypothetical protein